MNYNYDAIGRRIKLERKKLLLSQDSLAEKIGTTRQTLSQIERGKNKDYPFSYLVELCKIFDCELGYLLCEYDCKTRPSTDIHKETGLSERAINALKEYDKDALKILDAFITEKVAPKISEHIFTFFRFDNRISECIPCQLGKDDFGAADFVFPRSFMPIFGDACLYRLEQSVRLEFFRMVYTSALFNHFCEKVDRANAYVEINSCKERISIQESMLNASSVPSIEKAKSEVESRINEIRDYLTGIKRHNYWKAYQTYFGDDNIYFPSKDNYFSEDERPEFYTELWHI